MENADVLNAALPLLIGGGATLWLVIYFFHGLAYHFMLRIFEVDGVFFKRSMAQFTAYWLWLTVIFLMLIFAIIGLATNPSSQGVSLAAQAAGFIGVITLIATPFVWPLFVDRSYKLGYGQSFLIVILSQTAGGAMLAILGSLFFFLVASVLRITYGDEMDAAMDAAIEASQNSIEVEVDAETSSSLFVQ